MSFEMEQYHQLLLIDLKKETVSVKELSVKKAFCKFWFIDKKNIILRVNDGLVRVRIKPGTIN